MKAQLIQQLGAMDRRVLWALGCLLFVFFAMESWLLVLRGPLLEWRALVASHAAASAGETASTLAVEIERLKSDIGRTEQAIADSGLPKSDDAMVLHLIATLDALARQNGVSLGPVRFGGRLPEGGLQVVSFENEARGSYLSLLSWLAQAESAVAPLRASDLTLSASDEGRQVTLRVKFSTYLPPSPSPGVSK